MMKAGHFSVLGSNENINVLLSFETDNLTILQELSIFIITVCKLHLHKGNSYIKQTNLSYSKKKKKHQLLRMNIHLRIMPLCKKMSAIIGSYKQEMVL